MRLDWAGWLRTRAPRISCVCLALLAALSMAGCGATTSPSPSVVTPPPASPTPTPVVRLTDPAALNTVYSYLGRSGLRIIPNTASTGDAGIRGRLSATYDGWPLLITEYNSAAAMARAGFVTDATTGPGDPPFAIYGLNILVEFGPETSGRAPAKPDAHYLQAAQRLADLLTSLIGPLNQRSIVKLKLAPKATPAASKAPAKPKPSPSKK